MKHWNQEKAETNSTEEKKSDDSNSSKKSDESESKRSSAADDAKSKEQLAQENKISARFVDSDKYEKIEKILKDSGQFQNIVNGLDDAFILPSDAKLKIVFSEGDGPVYDPNTRTILMSYNFAQYLAQK